MREKGRLFNKASSVTYNIVRKAQTCLESQGIGNLLPTNLLKDTVGTYTVRQLRQR